MTITPPNLEKPARLPKHVAFIMDGNGRWAKQRGMPRLEGHAAGIKNLRSITRCLDQHGIKYITLYGFSTENWNRPKDEVDGLFRLLSSAVEEESIECHKNGIRLQHIGRLKELTLEMRQAISKAIELTKNNTGMTLTFAFNYGGRLEILDAVRRLIIDGIPPQDIDEKLFSNYLYTAGVPDVDLVIRTGGEIRISNFLMWQAAYSEYYFTPTLWPDFNEEELNKALLSYSQRQRRFGGLVSKE